MLWCWTPGEGGGGDNNVINATPSVQYPALIHCSLKMLCVVKKWIRWKLREFRRTQTQTTRDIVLQKINIRL